MDWNQPCAVAGGLAKQALNPNIRPVPFKVFFLAASFKRAPIDIGDGTTPDELLRRIDTVENSRKFIKLSKDRAFGIARERANAFVIAGINLIPGGASADAIDRGDFVDATVSFAGDVALLGLTRLKSAVAATRGLRGAELVQELNRLGKISVRLQQTELGIGALRLSQAGLATIQGEDGQAAGFLGEAVLRIFGVPFARTNVPLATTANAQRNVKVFRVEGQPNTRILLGEGGQVTIQGEQALFLNFGDKARAEAFLTKRLQQNLPGATVKQFEVPQSVLDDLRASAVPQSAARQFPNRPIIADPTKAPDQFGLRPEQIEALRPQIIQGTGREGF